MNRVGGCQWDGNSSTTKYRTQAKRYLEIAGEGKLRFSRGLGCGKILYKRHSAEAELSPKDGRSCSQRPLSAGPLDGRRRLRAVIGWQVVHCYFGRWCGARSWQTAGQSAPSVPGKPCGGGEERGVHRVQGWGWFGAGGRLEKGSKSRRCRWPESVKKTERKEVYSAW